MLGPRVVRLLCLVAGVDALHTPPIVLRRSGTAAMVASSQGRMPPRTGASPAYGSEGVNLEDAISRGGKRPVRASTGQARRQSGGKSRGGGMLEAAHDAAMAGDAAEAVSRVRVAMRAWSAAAPAPSEDVAAARRGGGGGAAMLAEVSLVREVNQLLRVLGDSGDLRAADDVFRCLIEARLTPTQVTYGTLIARAGTWRQPALATAYYRDMQRRGIEPDTLTHNSLINAFAKAQDLEKALEVAASMRRKGLTPTIVTYNTLLDGCARARNTTLASATLAELRKANLAPSVTISLG